MRHAVFLRSSALVAIAAVIAIAGAAPGRAQLAAPASTGVTGQAPTASQPPVAGQGALVVAVPPATQPTATPPLSQSVGTISDAMAAIRAGRWDAARAQIAAMGDATLASYARAELYVAARSPRVEGSAVRDLLVGAPALPQGAQLARMAQRRGVSDLPALPGEQRLVWAGSAPRRGNPRSVSDAGLADLPRQILARITADDPAGAEQLLIAAQGRLGPAALTEWQQRVAWSYYIENDDGNARRLAALAQRGAGDWVAQADWTEGLSSWRTGDCRTAMTAFRNVAGRAAESELEAAGHFWFARAATACGQPAEAQPALRRAARLDETFYGQLATETLGVRAAGPRMMANEATMRRVTALPNVRAAMALAEAGETTLAEEALKYQARIGAAADHQALIAIAGRMNLPEVQLYLAHNTPSGQPVDAAARYPAPQWTPATGWHISPAYLYAHALQESQFRPRVVSPAGAVGLMQVRPGTAGDMGLAGMGGSLTDPATNMALGQSYIEYLRDDPAIGNKLPKVIAAYNAGPAPVARWNSEIRDNGDPLLFIESIPYWETRAYVGTVLRNMWMYERQMGLSSDSRSLLAQGRWPTVPAAPARTTLPRSTR